MSGIDRLRSDGIRERLRQEGVVKTLLRRGNGGGRLKKWRVLSRQYIWRKCQERDQEGDQDKMGRLLDLTMYTELHCIH